MKNSLILMVLDRFCDELAGNGSECLDYTRKEGFLEGFFPLFLKKFFKNPVCFDFL